LLIKNRGRQTAFNPAAAVTIKKDKPEAEGKSQANRSVDLGPIRELGDRKAKRRSSQQSIAVSFGGESRSGHRKTV